MILTPTLYVEMLTEKILKNEFTVDENHIGLSIKPKSAGTVTIIGTSVVPEFPIIVPLMIIGITMVIVLQLRSKIILR